MKVKDILNVYDFRFLFKVIIAEESQNVLKFNPHKDLQKAIVAYGDKEVQNFYVDCENQYLYIRF